MALVKAGKGEPADGAGLYYSVALVGILAIVVGASVRLRRPNDPATLHFFWLTVAFFGVLAFTPSGRYDRLDYGSSTGRTSSRGSCCRRCSCTSRSSFPIGTTLGPRARRAALVIPLVYLPASALGWAASWSWPRICAGRGGAARAPRCRPRLYLAACLLAASALMVRALTRLRSVTARRQLRWIVWGMAVGVLPFVALYVLPFCSAIAVRCAEYTAVLLGCVPLAFASAIVRYRLMDIEVIIKKVLVVAAVVLLLA